MNILIDNLPKNQQYFNKTCRKSLKFYRQLSKKSENILPEKKTHSPTQYCYNSVRQYDYENFLCTLLLQGNIRRSAMAIRAFNVEISKIASLVSEDKIGVMRLKFWQDAIEKIYSNPNGPLPDHPVINELKLAIDNNFLPKLYFNRLIKARERSSKIGFITTTEVEQYAEDSVSSAYYLIAKVANTKSIDVDHAISHLGKSQGIINMLRAQQRQTDRRKVVICIPQEILIKHGVSQERVLRDNVNDKALQECVFEIASVASIHLTKARNLSHKVPSNIRPLLLPAVSVDRFLERLRRVDFQLSHASLSRRDAFLPISYYWHLFRNVY